MKAEIKLNTNKNYKAGCPVVFYYHHGKIRKTISLGWFFQKDAWNFENQQPLSSAPLFDFVYPKLINFRYKINQLRANGETNLENYLAVLNLSAEAEIDVLQKRIKELQATSKMGVLAFFDVRIAEKKQKKESFRAYEEAKIQVAYYIEEDQSLDLITYEWLNGFILFKKTMGTGMPGIMAYLRTIRAVYKESQCRKSLNIKQDNPFLGIIKTVSSEKVVEITVEDFKKLQEYTSKKFATKKANYTMRRAMHLWLFQFVIGGHDLIDVAMLRWDDLKNDRLIFRRYKNRNKPSRGSIVSNSVVGFARSFIEKYGTKDDDSIFSWLPSPDSNLEGYDIFSRNYRRALKNISEAQDLTTKLNTKTSRYVFRSLGGELLINDLVVMQIQGHKPSGVTFNYQNALPNKIIDLHHQVILDHVGIQLLV